MELVIKNGNVVTELGVVRTDIRLQEEKIIELRPGLKPAFDATIIDASGLMVLPGVIDAHTHYNLFVRGARTADDFYTGSRSAACGGVTTFIDYADPISGKSLAFAMGKRRKEAQGEACIDYHLHMCLYGEHPWDAKELLELREAGVRNLKVFTTYGDMQVSFDNLERLLVASQGLGMLVTVHAEDDRLILKAADELLAQGKTGPAYHGLSRPADAEAQAIANVLKTAEKHGAPVYFVHVSTEAGIRLIQEAKARGVVIFAETCPHYLVLTEACFQRELPQQYIMSPPLRTSQDNSVLWQALSGGSLQVVATDHCSYNLDQKRAGETCFTTLPGIPGSETLLPIIVGEGITKGRLTWEQVAAYLATNPAKLFGLYPQKGVIREGSDGDLVLVDPTLEKYLTDNDMHSVAGYTPFHGLTVQGYPVTTIMRGRIIYQNGEFVGERGWGRFVPAKEIIWDCLG